MFDALNLDEQTLQDLLAVLPSLPEEEKRTLLHDLQRLEEVKSREQCREEFIPFVQRMWPGFISGRHHKTSASPPRI